MTFQHGLFASRSQPFSVNNSDTPLFKLDIMFEEIKIGFAAGIPFRVIDDLNVKPLCGLNMQELNLNAPYEILKIIKHILS